ncbi:bifunctional [glutamine synthetase] adenylyltransferase/[glutamine synthetase]-adenylyl-L-tyrosine phosphorylase [Natronoglycomyces albus]|uniref:Bifunctional [glutamine synthetase] adenylyltransferase/[glutamine synthetase]-adenylyl-L-tyrosine phosphorylase n=1 Tax=Natronoglycomyces albus TaxID=2811108 RepID=A0A895XSZ6_9ACTN|nr:bifunctional [glutamine synthetase] adenylyltransferase/[glutamine synthetase]-adenylyl-L-tyrosine phosphorylase [Natronoglycomyces albus]QSB06439.1 bifunctional [glutamine synthetase] adenylyltransferase/[glutamine synthetase]-adenylyl-L-tyrosine phosphorylase [Natronoglycomyces albus]
MNDILASASKALAEVTPATLEDLGQATEANLTKTWRGNLARIAIEDLSGRADLTQTTAAISQLADAVIQRGLALAEAEHPLPEGTRLAIIAMGKSGGYELNYVSDVDVVFVAQGDLSAASNLAARTMQICSAATWPIDAGLRPEGRNGALVRTIGSYLEYLKHWARTWEFQALLKARACAGDMRLGQEWMDAIAPMVWEASLRPGIVEDVRAMRRKVEQSIPAHRAAAEIKLGPGGLRDIEFAVQLLQLVHGRGDESLRVRSTLEALDALVEGGYLGREDGADLARTYTFLRTVEHRLQLQQLRRTHRIPDDGEKLHWLARSLGHRSVEQFRSEWAKHAATARRLHEKLMYRPLLEAVTRVPTNELQLSTEAAHSRLSILGYADPARAMGHIKSLTAGLTRTATIQSTLLPVMLRSFAASPEPDRGLLAYRQVSEKLGRTPWFLKLLRDGGPAAVRLARLLGSSRYLTNLLLRHPESLRILSEDSELAPRNATDLAAGLFAAVDRHSDPHAAVAVIRALRRRELIRVAAANLLLLIDIDEVGTALTDITDVTLQATLRAAARAVGSTVPIAIIGMGRLGGGEMGYGSDADVLYVHAGTTDEERTHAREIIELTQKLLAAPAGDDPPVDLDAGLRPEGKGGALVPSLETYRRYYEKRARLWERQALLRARPVAGDEGLCEQFIALANEHRYPQGGLSDAELIEFRRMKARVETERLPQGADPSWHTKLGRGGLVDVEWSAQLLQLRHAAQIPQLRTWGTVPALQAARSARLAETGALDDLIASWQLVSRVRNAITLSRGTSRDELPRNAAELQVLAQILGYEPDSEEFTDRYLRLTRKGHIAATKLVYDVDNLNGLN